MELIISRSDAAELAPIIAAAKREDLTFGKTTKLYAGRVNGDLVAMAGMIWHKRSCVIKNLYVQPELRRRGLMRQLLDYQLRLARQCGMVYADATCTAMSLPEFLKRGGRVTRQYKRFTSVRIDLSGAAWQ